MTRILRKCKEPGELWLEVWLMMAQPLGGYQVGSNPQRNISISLALTWYIPASQISCVASKIR